MLRDTARFLDLTNPEPGGVWSPIPDFRLAINVAYKRKTASALACTTATIARVIAYHYVAPRTFCDGSQEAASTRGSVRRDGNA